MFKKIKEGQVNHQQTYDYYEKLYKEKQEEQRMFEEKFINKKHDDRILEMELKNHENQMIRDQINKEQREFLLNQIKNNQNQKLALTRLEEMEEEKIINEHIRKNLEREINERNKIQSNKNKTRNELKQ